MSNEKSTQRRFDVSRVNRPKFLKYSDLTLAQRNDPDYRLKKLERLNGNRLSITCSKCHHCR